MGTLSDLDWQTTEKVVTQETVSKSLDTTYQNIRSHTIHIVATIRCITSLAGGNAYAQFFSDFASPPVTKASGIVGIQAGLLNEDNTFEISAYILPTRNYKLTTSTTNGTVTLDSWFETEIPDIVNA